MKIEREVRREKKINGMSDDIRVNDQAAAALKSCGHTAPQLAGTYVTDLYQ
jgi:hypothetical protein